MYIILYNITLYYVILHHIKYTFLYTNVLSREMINQFPECKGLWLSNRIIYKKKTYCKKKKIILNLYNWIGYKQLKWFSTCIQRFFFFSSLYFLCGVRIPEKKVLASSSIINICDIFFPFFFFLINGVQFPEMRMFVSQWIIHFYVCN